MPFGGDDFLILERVRDASFGDLFRRSGSQIFGWYRPISRELYYWLMRGAFGLREPYFHAANVALWVGVLLVLFRFLHGLTGSRAAAITVAGTASLAAWAYPLLSINGVQDLWMLLFGFLFMDASRRGRRGIAALWFALSFFSKESALMFLPISIAIAMIVDRHGARRALSLHAPALSACAIGLLIHPTLMARVSGHSENPLETTSRLPPWAMVLAPPLAAVNLEAWPLPLAGWGPSVVLGLASALPLLVILHRGLRSPPAPPASKPNLLLACALWALLGFAPAAFPSIGWHVYYSIIGLIGTWAMLGILLDRHPRIALAAIALMALVRAGRATTSSIDWVDEWSQVQIGERLNRVRESLQRLHPTFPPHSRVYFTHTANKAGQVSGGSPALRIWYDDPTLRSFHMRDFAVRRPDEPQGKDYFFYFDPAGRPIEIVPSRHGRPPDSLVPGWEGQHYDLGTVLLLGGDVEGAANEYLAVARAHPARVDCALYAAACFRVLGRAAPAGQALALARAAGLSASEAEQRIQRLIESFPSRPRAAAP